MTKADALVLGDAGVLAPGRWRWARALGWMVSLVLAIGLVTALPAAIRALAAPDAAAMRVLGIAVIPLAYLAYAGLVRRAERRPMRELDLRALPRDLAIGLLIGLGMFALVFASLRLLGVYTLAAGSWTDWPTDLIRDLATGLIEELVVRLVIFRLLMRALGLWPALALSALLFGAGHLGNANASLVAAAAIAVEAGLMLAAFLLLTGRIWMSVGVHAAWNFAQGPIFGARVSGQGDAGSLFASAPVPGSADLLSGGAFGPEASLSAIVVGAAIFGWVMAAVRRRGLVAPRD